MHPGAYNFVKACADRLGPRHVILEYGGRNINGSVRGLFEGSSYTSIDMQWGPGVDIQADAVTYIPEVQPDTIICCEVLEHYRAWPEIVMAAGRILVNDGVLILTCACPPRIAHSGHDGGQLVAGEFYENIDPLELTVVLDRAGFEQHETTVQERDGDLQVLAWKRIPA